MVPRPGASLGAHTLRALNAPVRLTVHTDDAGQPVAVYRDGWSRPCRVARVQESWRIDDEWWREQPISRLYFMLLLENDLLLTIYHDLMTDVWYEQRG
jgi:hypothetical protein